MGVLPFGPPIFDDPHTSTWGQGWDLDVDCNLIPSGVSAFGGPYGVGYISFGSAPVGGAGFGQVGFRSVRA